jgi:hypothetical protein
MVIENENAVLLAVRYLGRPVTLPIPKDAEELARRHAVMFTIDPYPGRVPQDAPHLAVWRIAYPATSGYRLALRSC